jgi:hypothetical protein
MRKMILAFSFSEEDILRSLRLIFFSSEGMLFLTAGVGVLAMLLWASAPVLAQEAISEEEPTPSSVDQMVTPMERSFEGKLWRPGLFPWIKEKLKDTNPFFRDTRLDLHLRTYYHLENDTGSKNKEAWAIGGDLLYQSGYFLDHFSVGAALSTSQPLYAPDDRDGTNLLSPSQEGYTVLSEIYGRVKLVGENFLNLYRYEYNTPYINKDDSKMTPNTFEGYVFQGATGDPSGGQRVAYGVGYIDKIKKQNDTTFQWMSQAAGVQVDRGVFAGGLNYFYRGFQIGAIDYYSQDIINIGYGEARYTLNVTDRLGFLFAAQYTDQRSVGSDLLTGSSFHATQFGLMTSASYRYGILTFAYTNVSTGADMQNPWSGYPGYTSVQVESFKRAGEEAFMVKGSYNFARLGLEEVTAYALWTHGWGAVNPATGSSVYQQDEYDFDLQWLPKSGFLKGFWFRARYAHVDSRDGTASGFPVNDIRFIVNYLFPLL